MLYLLGDGVQLEQITVTASAARRRLGGETAAGGVEGGGTVSRGVAGGGAQGGGAVGRGVAAGGVQGGGAAAGGTSRFLTELANTTTAPSAWVVSIQVAIAGT